MTASLLSQVIGGHIKNIQRGLKTLSSGNSSGTTTIAEVDLDKSFVSASVYTTRSSVQGLPMSWLSDSTTISFGRGLSLDSSTIFWEVIEYD